MAAEDQASYVLAILDTNASKYITPNYSIPKP